MTVNIMVGDCLELMRTMPDKSVQCVITSPPYWGLRDYQVDGQLGQEATLGEHLENMVDVFREIRRVLRDDGTVWLNYGDCYAAKPNGRSAAKVKELTDDDRTFRDKPHSTIGPIHAGKPRGVDRWGGGNNPAHGLLKPKDLCMVANRLAIALADDGWSVRSEIIWSKLNPMPESARDRPTASHEKIFLLTKACKKPIIWQARDTGEWSTDPDRSERVDIERKNKTVSVNRWIGFHYYYDADSVRTPSKPDSVERYERGRSDDHKYADGGPGDQTINKSFDHMRRPDVSGWAEDGVHTPAEHNKGKKKGDKQRGHGRRHAGFNERWDGMTRRQQMSKGANLRNVWPIGTKPFKHAHFATFPPELIIPCVLAGCPVGGMVFDPFGGAGTTAVVADDLMRDCILIELNEDYAELARSRIRAGLGTVTGMPEHQHLPGPLFGWTGGGE